MRGLAGVERVTTIPPQDDVAPCRRLRGECNCQMVISSSRASFKATEKPEVMRYRETGLLRCARKRLSDGLNLVGVMHGGGAADQKLYLWIDATQ